MQRHKYAASTICICMDEKALLAFVEPYYAKKDAMHGLPHIRRLLYEAQSIRGQYHVDKEVMTYAAYFHGIDVRKRLSDLMRFLASQGLSNRKAKRIILVASESHKESIPKTVEGKVLHDAHLVAGGRTFMVTNFLVTGALRGFPIEHTINYFEEEVDGRFKCYLPETRKRYSEMEKFAREFFRDLKRSLSRSVIQKT
jgi:uncharacterized protein